MAVVALPTRVPAAVAATAGCLLMACGGPQPPPAVPSPPTPPPVSAAPFGPGCAGFAPADASGSQDGTARQSLFAALASFPALSRFTAEFQSAEPFMALSGQRIATVFAPTDDAMARFGSEMGEDSYRSFTGEPSNVDTFVRHTLVGQRLDRDQMVSSGAGTVLDGDRLTVAPAGDTITIADPGGRRATVLCGDIATKDATLFITDNVLVSPTSQFSHVTPRQAVRCGPSTDAHDNAEICHDVPAVAGRG